MPPLIPLFLFVGLLLASLHGVGIYLYLYWYYTWFDMVTHLLGGLFIILGLGVFATLGWIPVTLVKKKRVVIGTLLFVMVAWELFEFSFGISDATDPSFVLDTVTDLLIGSTGGMLGYLVLRSKFKSTEIS